MGRHEHDLDAIRQALAELAVRAGTERVALRVDAENLETVYVERAGEGVCLHDRGETFAFLAGRSDDAYRPWDAGRAREAAAGSGVELRDESEPDAHAFRLARALAPGEPLARAIAQVAGAIDAVFAAHLRQGR